MPYLRCHLCGMRKHVHDHGYEATREWIAHYKTVHADKEPPTRKATTR